MDSLTKFCLKKEHCRPRTRRREASTHLSLLADKEQLRPEVAFDEVDGEDQTIDVSWFRILSQVAFACMSIGDTGSDIFTVYLYSYGYDYWFFWLTLIIIIVATVCVIGINLNCYHKEYVELEKDLPKQDRQPLCIWVVRILCNVLLLGPALRYLESAWYHFQTRRVSNRMDRRYFIARIKSSREIIAILSVVESYTEAAPQLGLQLYIMLNQEEPSLFRLMVQTVSCFFSWLSCTNALITQARVHRFDHNSNMSKQEPLRYLDLFLMFVWRFLMVGPRILAFSLLASVARYYYVLTIILAHWILATIYVTTRRFPSENNFVAEIFFCIVVGFVFIFTDWNTTNGHKRWQYIVYYVLLFAENTSMVVVWFILTPNSHQWYHLTVLIFITVGFGLGVLFMILYYVGLRTRDFKKCCGCREVEEVVPNVQYSEANVIVT